MTRYHMTPTTCLCGTEKRDAFVQVLAVGHTGSMALHNPSLIAAPIPAHGAAAETKLLQP